jgi:hypothetical protein
LDEEGGRGWFEKPAIGNFNRCIPTMSKLEKLYNMDSMRILISLVVTILATGTVFSDSKFPPKPNKILLNLKEGEKVRIGDSDVWVEVLKIDEKPGCLGGPIGCPVDVKLKLTKAKESKEIMLSAGLPLRKETADKASKNVYGYDINFLGVTKKGANLSLKPAP